MTVMMDKIINLLSNASLVSAGIIAISVFSLAAALTAQFVFDLQPCDLCLLQRIPFVITIILGLAGLFFTIKMKKPKTAALAVFLSALVFLAGAITAFYHSGVEQHWWVSFLEGCKVNFNPDNILAQIQAATAVRCDVIPWADPVFHLSMASWNAIMSTGLAAGCFISSVLIARRANGF